MKIILDKLKIKDDIPMQLYFSYKSSMSIANNPGKHDGIRHIKIDTLHQR